jgi:hypothetical protein
MKSSVKIAYQSRFGDHIGDREPLIRAELDLTSDDPRDDLAKTLLHGESPKLGCSLLTQTTPDKKSYVIYRLSREEYLYQKADALYTAFVVLYGETLERVYDSIAITFSDTLTKKRSAGVKPIDYIYLEDETFIRAVTLDFLAFKKISKKA